MMKNKKIKSIVIIILIILANIIVSYIRCYGFSLAFGNLQCEVKSLEQMTIAGYQKEGDTLVSTTADPGILDLDIAQSYKYIFIEIHHLSSEDSIRVYYANNEQFSEDKSILQRVHDGKNMIRLPNSCEYNTVRINIGTKEQLQFDLKSIVYSNGIIIGEELLWNFIMFLILEMILYTLYRNREYISNHKTEVFILLFCGLIYYLWSVILPYNKAPDEVMRYDIPNYIFYHNNLPRGDDPEICNDIFGTSYAFQPILSYIFSAFAMKIAVLGLGMAEINMFHAARWISVISSCITVLYLLKISKKLFHGKKLMVVLVALLPQFVFISSYVNNDALAVMSTAIIFYYWLEVLENNWKVSSCIVLSVGMSICALSYYNAYGLLLCSAILFIINFIADIRKSVDKKRILLKYVNRAAVMIGIVAILAGWWFIRSFILYDGDILGLETTRKLQQLNGSYSILFSVYQQGYSLKYMLIDMQWIEKVIMSFIGTFDYMILWLPGWLYKIYFVILLMGLAGCFYQNNKIKESKKSLIIISILTILITVGLSVGYSYFSDCQAQGRYLLPMLIPFMYFLSIGIENIESKIQTFLKVNLPVQKIVIVFWTLSSILILTNIIVPYYYW